jgi:heterodisulfide reductase subunit C
VVDRALIALAGRGYNHLKDVVVITVLFGVGTFIRFRLIDKVKRLAYGWHAWVVLGVIATMMIADVVYDAGHLLGLALRGPGEGRERFAWDAAAPLASLGELGWTSGDLLGGLLARGLGAFITNPDTAHAVGQAGYWTHVFLVFAFLNYLPYGKHFHVITSLPNVIARPLDPPGRLRTLATSADALMEDMGKAMELPDASAAPIGIARMNHFTWKAMLDFYTCTECGRCSDNCPAHRTGKLLSPKHLTIDLRDHLYSLQDAVAEGAPAPAAKADAPADGDAAPAPPAGPFSVNLVPDVIHPDVLWACTTCRACEEQCPVMITYVDKIVDMRRNLVMLRGEFPAELQKTFTALETNGNPWNITRQDRAEWTAGLDVPLMADTPDAEVLYWVGCAASYDDRAKKIARATVKLFQKAGVKFAILGHGGDLHRRPGAPRGQRAPLPHARRAERRHAQQLQAEEDRHHLPPLLQHPAQRVPRPRREATRWCTTPTTSSGCSRRSKIVPTKPRERQGRLPRLVLPRPLQRGVRAPARGAQAHRGRRAGRGRVEPREGPLLRRRRRADVDGGAARHRARQQAPHAPARQHGRGGGRVGLPLLPDDAHRRHQGHGGGAEAPRGAARRGRAPGAGGRVPREARRRARRRSLGVAPASAAPWRHTSQFSLISG